MYYKERDLNKIFNNNNFILLIFMFKRISKKIL